MPTIRQAISEAIRTLAHEHGRRDAETLLAHTLAATRTTIFAQPETPLTAQQQAAFAALIQRRAAHEPLQYLTGTQEFYGLALRVTPGTLIPRPETEHLVEAVLLWATRFHDPQTLRIADIGTGSGAIAIALATHLAGATFFATDISAAALNVARENALTHGCDQRIQFLESDLLSVLGGQPLLDAIVSNPPYIPTGDAPTMQPEVVSHEPHSALFAGPDGLDIYRRLVPAAQAALNECGLLALEIGHGQRDAITALLSGWNDVHFVNDYAGIPRVALATRP